MSNRKSVYSEIEKLSKLQQENHKEVDTRLDNIEKILVVQETNLQIHMKRSDNLEKLVQTLQEKDIQPLRKHVNMVEGALKFIGLFGLAVSIFVSLFKLFGVI